MQSRFEQTKLHFIFLLHKLASIWHVDLVMSCMFCQLEDRRCFLIVIWVMGILGEDFCFKTKFNRLRQLKTSSRVWELVVLLQHEYFRQLAHRNNYKCLQIRRDFHLRLLDFYLEQVWQHKHSFLRMKECLCVEMWIKSGIPFNLRKQWVSC